MEMTARRGRGYVAANRTRSPATPSAPSRSTPVLPDRKVNYQVTNARVGQVTDYDRLTLEVWTDGSVSPGRGGLCGEDHQGAAHGLHQLR